MSFTVVPHILSKLGIHRKSGHIYCALIAQGNQNISQVARSAHMTRAEAYRYIPYLIEAGLVTQLKHGKRLFYSANPPTNLLALADSEFQRTRETIAELQRSFETKNSDSEVSVTRGENGIRSVFTDIMRSWKQGDTFYRITSERNTQKSNSYMPKGYREKRADKDVFLYLIAPTEVAREKKPRLDREIAVLPADMHSFDDDISLTLYADTLAYIDFRSTLTITVTDKNLVAFHKKLFDLLFRLLRNHGNNSR